MGKADVMEATANSGDSADVDTLIRRQRRWARRQRTFEKWRRAYDAGRELGLHHRPARDKLAALVKPVTTVDRFAQREQHLVPRQPGLRLRVAGRRVALQMASWLLWKGPAGPEYQAVQICGVDGCCKHLKLILRRRKSL
jgi:hypothetical protein